MRAIDAAYSKMLKRGVERNDPMRMSGPGYCLKNGSESDRVGTASELVPPGIRWWERLGSNSERDTDRGCSLPSVHPHHILLPPSDVSSAHPSSEPCPSGHAAKPSTPSTLSRAMLPSSRPCVRPVEKNSSLAIPERVKYLHGIGYSVSSSFA